MERELEVKILNIDLEKMEKEIINLGAKLIADELQINTLIDSKEKPIKSYVNGYLRIRETKDLLKDKVNLNLTLKKNINLEGIRDNEELTVEISNRNTMLKIFKDLGFDQVEVGHKKRRSYQLNGVRFDFDQWDPKTYPFPYMEIEVKDKEDLDYMVKLLGIPEENISTKSIMELKKELE